MEWMMELKCDHGGSSALQIENLTVRTSSVFFSSQKYFFSSHYLCHGLNDLNTPNRAGNPHSNIQTTSADHTTLPSNTTTFPLPFTMSYPVPQSGRAVSTNRSRQSRSGAFPATGTQRAARPLATSTEDGVTVESEVTDDNDMSLLCSISGHKTTIRDAVKKDLFKVCKFITSNNDLDYSLSSGICGLMLKKCTIASNSRKWWCYVKPIVKRTLADHRNNRIKTLQQYYIGKSTVCHLP